MQLACRQRAAVATSASGCGTAPAAPRSAAPGIGASFEEDARTPRPNASRGVDRRLLERPAGEVLMPHQNRLRSVRTFEKSIDSSAQLAKFSCVVRLRSPVVAMLATVSLVACALQGRRLDSPIYRDLRGWMTDTTLAPEFCARETRLHKVAPADFDGLRGVMALEDIAPGEEIVAIPARFALDLGTSSTDPLAAAEKLCVEPTIKPLRLRSNLSGLG